MVKRYYFSIQAGRLSIYCLDIYKNISHNNLKKKRVKKWDFLKV